MTETTRPSRESGEFAEQVNRMFDRVAKRYDLLNSLMTAGLHHAWRVRAADRAAIAAGDAVLDVCCGTGDLSFELAERVAPGGSVVGCDFSEPMLDLAREKAAERGVEGVRFEWADGLELPYDEGRFDAVTVGFGLRNFADHDRGIAEMARVLKPGGRAMILEFTEPRRFPFSAFYSLWFDRIAPLLGRLSNDPEAYAYLAESVHSYPDPPAVAAKMEAAGFGEIRWLLLAGGILTIHSGVRG